MRQGGAISATLFILTIESIILEIDINGTIATKSVQIVAYADDLAIISRDKKSLTKVITDLQIASKRRGLQINEKKTKYMHCSRSIGYTKTHMKIGTMSFEEVEEFRYLGIIIDRGGGRHQEIKNRILMGNRMFYKYRRLLMDKALTKNTKLKIYNTLIKPVLMYGAEIMVLTLKDEEHLKIFKTKSCTIDLWRSKRRWSNEKTNEHRNT